MAGALMMILKLFNYLTDFSKGIIAGFLLSAIIFSFVVGFMAHRMKVKEMTNYVLEYVEKQQIIEDLREDYINRDPVEFLEVPGVRRAVDGAAAEFEQRRDEALYRFRNRLVD
jgi:MFS superfamily sulfate permease-like transporter